MTWSALQVLPARNTVWELATIGTCLNRDIRRKKNEKNFGIISTLYVFYYQVRSSSQKLNHFKYLTRIPIGRRMNCSDCSSLLCSELDPALYINFFISSMNGRWVNKITSQEKTTFILVLQKCAWLVHVARKLFLMSINTVPANFKVACSFANFNDRRKLSHEQT